MHVISKKRLALFWGVHRQAEKPLRAWWRDARRAQWTKFAEVRRQYGSVDQVGRFTVFDIGGNKYRLIAVIHFNRGVVYVRNVLTHAEYDRGGWKE